MLPWLLPWLLPWSSLLPWLLPWLLPLLPRRVRPLTRGDTHADGGGKRVVTPPPASRSTRGDGRTGGKGSATSWRCGGEARDPGQQYDYGTWHQPRGIVTKKSKAAEKGNTKGLLKGATQRKVTFESTPPTVIPTEQTDEESDSYSEGTEERQFIHGQRKPREARVRRRKQRMG